MRHETHDNERSARRPRFHLRGCRGITLIENMVATGLVSVTACGLFSSGNLASKSVSLQLQTTGASALAMQKIEEIRATGFDNVLLLQPYQDQTITLHDNFRVTRHVVLVGHNAVGAVLQNMKDAAYLEVHVRVSYYSLMDKCTRTESYSTLVNRALKGTL